MKLFVAVVCYRVRDLTIACLRALSREFDTSGNRVGGCKTAPEAIHQSRSWKLSILLNISSSSKALDGADVLRPMSELSIVVIGRNEGERLRHCLDAVVGRSYFVVYVDSGSTDGSAELARAKGAEVVELDMSLPFTAARAATPASHTSRSGLPRPVLFSSSTGIASWSTAGSKRLGAC